MAATGVGDTECAGLVFGRTVASVKFDPMSLRHINAVAAFAVQGAAVALIACTAGHDASPRAERNAAAANRRAADHLLMASGITVADTAGR